VRNRGSRVAPGQRVYSTTAAATLRRSRQRRRILNYCNNIHITVMYTEERAREEKHQKTLIIFILKGVTVNDLSYQTTISSTKENYIEE